MEQVYKGDLMLPQDFLPTFKFETEKASMY